MPETAKIRLRTPNFMHPDEEKVDVISLEVGPNGLEALNDLLKEANNVHEKDRPAVCVTGRFKTPAGKWSHIELRVTDAD